MDLTYTKNLLKNLFLKPWLNSESLENFAKKHLVRTIILIFYLFKIVFCVFFPSTSSQHEIQSALVINLIQVPEPALLLGKKIRPDPSWNLARSQSGLKRLCFPRLLFFLKGSFVYFDLFLEKIHLFCWRQHIFKAFYSNILAGSSR